MPKKSNKLKNKHILIIILAVLIPWIASLLIQTHISINSTSKYKMYKYEASEHSYALGFMMGFNCGKSYRFKTRELADEEIKETVTEPLKDMVFVTGLSNTRAIATQMNRFIMNWFDHRSNCIGEFK